MRKKIAILGSTGSIGNSTLDLCRQHPDRFEVVALSAGKNTDVLLQQVREFSPKLVSVGSEDDCQRIRSRLSGTVTLLFGEEGAKAVALSEADTVVSAIVGAAGLIPTKAAIEAGKTIALANKESMIIAGALLSELARKNNATILPVDSEHSALFQCLHRENREDITRLVLTASGGPFWNTPKDHFSKITKLQALKHPNWDMGAKITIDSATMMNKGLEMIEARFLFAMPAEKISVVVHPQSIIHSMVEFCDGSVLAQMGEPDMRVPIAYALSYPKRIPTGVKSLSLPHHEKLTFFAPDFEKFPCLQLASDVLKKEKSFVPVLNAANEIAVASFLNDEISFVEIPVFIEKTLETHDVFDLKIIEDVLEADRWARAKTRENIEKCRGGFYT